MKRMVICLLTVVMLVMMMLPADIAVARGPGHRIPTATNETTESLVADFDFSVCPSCSRGTRISVTFTDNSAGGVKPYKYAWDFGDGSNSTRENPRHRYASADNYTVTLTVTDRVGNVASKSETVTLELGANTESVSSNSMKGGGGPWPRCISGCTANDVEINTVWLDIPTGNYTLGETVTGNVSMNLKFHRQNTYCIVVVADLYEGGVLKQADWVSDIIGFHDGDGTQTYLMGTVSWTYGELFEMRNVLVMWDVNPADGTCPTDCSNYIKSKCFQPADIIVHTPLVADFDFNDVCFCNNTIFTDTTTGGNTSSPYTYDWDFGGSYTYSGEDPTELQNPVIHYNGPGTYTVTLNVTDYDGTTDSQSHDVTVYPNPTVTLEGDTTFCEEGGTTITASVTGGTPDYTYDWSESTAPGTPNNGSYTATGSGTVEVTVTDAHNCTDSDNVTVVFEDCDDLDYYDGWEYYCVGDEVWMHRLFHDYSCVGGECAEVDSYYTDDQLVEDCNLSDYYDEWEFYCVGDEVWMHHMFHDFSCVDGV